MDTKELIAQLEAIVAVHGLPKEVGARGWITETHGWEHDGKYLATSEDGLKGWIYLPRDTDESGEATYSNTIELARAVESFINGSADGIYLHLYDGDEIVAAPQLSNDEADGKSWEWSSHKELAELAELYTELSGEEVEEDSEDFLHSLFWDHCTEADSEVEYSLSYGIAWLEFDDGFKVGFMEEDGKPVQRQPD